jgi:uncharacterized protein (TIGR00251 family)
VSERSGETLTLRVRVKPRASKSRVVGYKDGVLEVAVAAAPVDGAANEELVRTLAEHFDVPKSTIAIVSGQASRLKLARFEQPPNSLRSRAVDPTRGDPRRGR